MAAVAEVLVVAVALLTVGVAAATVALPPGVVVTEAGIALAHPDTVPTNGIRSVGLGDLNAIALLSPRLTQSI